MNIAGMTIRLTPADAGRFALALALWLGRAAHAALFGAGALAALAVWFLGKPGMLDGAAATEVQVSYYYAVAWGSVLGLLIAFSVRGPRL